MIRNIEIYAYKVNEKKVEGKKKLPPKKGKYVSVVCGSTDNSDPRARPEMFPADYHRAIFKCASSSPLGYFLTRFPSFGWRLSGAPFLGLKWRSYRLLMGARLGAFSIRGEKRRRSGVNCNCLVCRQEQRVAIQPIDPCFFDGLTLVAEKSGDPICAGMILEMM